MVSVPFIEELQRRLEQNPEPAESIMGIVTGITEFSVENILVLEITNGNVVKNGALHLGEGNQKPLLGDWVSGILHSLEDPLEWDNQEFRCWLDFENGTDLEEKKAFEYFRRQNKNSPSP